MFKPHHWLDDLNLPLLLFLEPPRAVLRSAGMYTLASNLVSENAIPSLHETAALWSEHLWCVCRGDRNSDQGEAGPWVSYPGDLGKNSAWQTHSPFPVGEDRVPSSTAHLWRPACPPVLPDVWGVYSFPVIRGQKAVFEEVRTERGRGGGRLPLRRPTQWKAEAPLPALA